MTLLMGQVNFTVATEKVREGFSAVVILQVFL